MGMSDNGIFNTVDTTALTPELTKIFFNTETNARQTIPSEIRMPSDVEGFMNIMY